MLTEKLRGHAKPVGFSTCMIILGKVIEGIPRHFSTKSGHGYEWDVPSIVNSEMWYNFRVQK